MTDLGVMTVLTTSKMLIKVIWKDLFSFKVIRLIYFPYISQIFYLKLYTSLYRPFWSRSVSLLPDSSNHRILKSSITEMEYIEIKEIEKRNATERGF